MVTKDHSHLVCPHCGALNRLLRERRAADARCGSCHQALFEGRPVAVDVAQFERHVGTDEIPVCTARSKPAPRHARNRRLKTLETGTASRSNPATDHAANRHLITA